MQILNFKWSGDSGESSESDESGEASLTIITVIIIIITIVAIVAIVSVIIVVGIVIVFSISILAADVVYVGLLKTAKSWCRWYLVVHINIMIILNVEQQMYTPVIDGGLSQATGSVIWECSLTNQSINKRASAKEKLVWERFKTKLNKN